MAKHTISSQSPLNSARLSAGATGTANTRRAGWLRRDPTQRRPDRAAGCNAVIDNDRGAAFDRYGGPIAEIAPPPALDLGQLAPLFLFDVGGGRPYLADYLLVQHQMRLIAVDDRADPELGMTRGADLAHEQDIERRTQRLRDLEADRHAAARQGEHDRVVLLVAGQRLREQPSGLAPILEKRPEKRHFRLLRRKSACQAPASRARCRRNQRIA